MSTSTKDSSRLPWMDAVRGTAIGLLLIWHASAVPVLFGQEMPEVIRTANEFFLPFRMPTLMFLSGMLLVKSLRKPLSEYYAGKFAMVVWPYVIWVIIARVTFLDIGEIPWWHWRGWYASTYLWFLFFIAVYYLIAPAFRRLPPWLPVLAAAAAGLVLEPGGTEQRMSYFAVFFFAGNWLAHRPDALKLLSHRWTIPITAVPVIGFGVASCLWPDALHFSVWGAPASILGTIFLIACFMKLTSAGHNLRMLTFAGRSSLVFYVSHFPPMALLSLWLIGHIDATLLAALNFVVAVLVGLLLAHWSKRIPAIWLFEAPARLRGAVKNSLSVLDRTRPNGPEQLSRAELRP